MNTSIRARTHRHTSTQTHACARACTSARSCACTRTYAHVWMRRRTRKRATTPGSLMRTCVCLHATVRAAAQPCAAFPHSHTHPNPLVRARLWQMTAVRIKTDANDHDLVKIKEDLETKAARMQVARKRPCEHIRGLVHAGPSSA
eukprot:3872423-Pleurochrysis_carterae.AAC.1